MSKTKLDITLETLVELVDLDRKQSVANFERVTANIEALTLNIAQLTAQQKQTAHNLDKLGDRLDRITTALEAQIRLSQSQSENIALLTQLATALATKN